MATEGTYDDTFDESDFATNYAVKSPNVNRSTIRSGKSWLGLGQDGLRIVAEPETQIWNIKVVELLSSLDDTEVTQDQKTKIQAALQDADIQTTRNLIQLTLADLKEMFPRKYALRNTVLEMQRMARQFHSEHETRTRRPSACMSQEFSPVPDMNHNFHGLILSVSKYPKFEQKEEKTMSCEQYRRCVANDGKDMKNALTGPFMAYPEANVGHYCDPTKRQIETAFEDLIKRTDEDSTVIIFLSCHGDYLGRDLVILPSDYDPDNRPETIVRGKDIWDFLKRIRAKKKLLVLDCCHSGSLIGKQGARSEEFYKQLAEGTGTVIITSCAASEISVTDKVHSLFTKHVLGAFENKLFHFEGRLTLNNLIAYVTWKVPYEAMLKMWYDSNNKVQVQHTQNPQVHMEEITGSWPLAIFADPAAEVEGGTEPEGTKMKMKSREDLEMAINKGIDEIVEMTQMIEDPKSGAFVPKGGLEDGIVGIADITLICDPRNNKAVQASMQNKIEQVATLWQLEWLDDRKTVPDVERGFKDLQRDLEKATEHFHRQQAKLRTYQWAMNTYQHVPSFGDEDTQSDDQSHMDQRPSTMFSGRAARANEGSMQVFITVRQQGKTFSLNVSPKHTVFQVKQLLEDMLNISAHKMRLLYKNKQLTNARMLDDYAIGKEAQLYLALALCGGTKGGGFESDTVESIVDVAVRKLMEPTVNAQAYDWDYLRYGISYWGKCTNMKKEADGITYVCLTHSSTYGYGRSWTQWQSGDRTIDARDTDTGAELMEESEYGSANRPLYGFVAGSYQKVGEKWEVVFDKVQSGDEMVDNTGFANGIGEEDYFDHKNKFVCYYCKCPIKPLQIVAYKTPLSMEYHKSNETINIDNKDLKKDDGEAIDKSDGYWKHVQNMVRGSMGCRKPLFVQFSGEKREIEDVDLDKTPFEVTFKSLGPVQYPNDSTKVKHPEYTLTTVKGNLCHVITKGYLQLGADDNPLSASNSYVKYRTLKFRALPLDT